MRTVGGEDLCDPLEMGAEMKMRSPQVTCYRTGNNTGTLDLEEPRERYRSAVSLLAFLAGVVCLSILPACIYVHNMHA